MLKSSCRLWNPETQIQDFRAIGAELEITWKGIYYNLYHLDNF